VEKPITSSNQLVLRGKELARLSSYDDTETLTRLGLTERQAKVYLALLRIGPSKAEAISIASSVHRPEVYRVVDRLQEIGLAEKHLSTPTMFSAVPINDAVAVLVSRKTMELKETYRKAKSLISRLDQENGPAKRKLAESPVLVISENEYFKKMRCSVEKSRNSVEVVTTSERLRSWFFLFDSLLEKTLRRNVAIRVITEEHENRLLPKNLVAFSETQFGFELRTVINAPSASVVILDNREVSAIINRTDSLTSETHLWSNNESWLALCQGYFNSLWSQGKPVTSLAQSMALKLTT
jgi:sugar-specific transcriptional regulator TrmB